MPESVVFGSLYGLAQLPSHCINGVSVLTFCLQPWRPFLSCTFLVWLYLWRLQISGCTLSPASPGWEFLKAFSRSFLFSLMWLHISTASSVSHTADFRPSLLSRRGPTLYSSLSFPISKALAHYFPLLPALPLLQSSYFCGYSLSCQSFSRYLLSVQILTYFLCATCQRGCFMQFIARRQR